MTRNRNKCRAEFVYFLSLVSARECISRPVRSACKICQSTTVLPGFYPCRFAACVARQKRSIRVAEGAMGELTRQQYLKLRLS